MKPWITFAILSMIFAGVTSTIAKLGLAGISAEVGLTVRTAFVFALILMFAAFTVSPGQLASLAPANYFWLGLSGLATALSWIFYYRALKDGEVSTIALIDKGSILVAIALAWLILKEPITPRVALGGLLMLAGLVVIANK